MNIDINFDDVIDELNLTAVQADDLAHFVVQSVTNLIFNTWRATAGRELGSTRNQYINGLQVVEEGRLKNSIVLFGSLNNMIEQGASPFDMKAGLLNGPNAKTDSKGNKYNTVPFRFGVPGTLGENQAFSGVMPKEVYAALAQVIRSGGNSLPQSKVPAPFNNPQTRQAIQRTPSTPPYSSYTNKVSIYSGLKQTGRKFHHQYKTFRRVSINSDPGAFIHPGFQPRDLARMAVETADIPNAVENFIDQYQSTL